jgi:peptidoglycan-associated lipoprotein
MKNIIYLAFILLMFGVLINGCATRKVVTDADTAETAGAAETEEAEGDKDLPPGGVTAQDISRPFDPEDIESVSSFFREVYFGYDRYNITSEAAARLNELSNWLINHDAAVIIEGHCDERGTNQYNLALGDRRANSVKDFLIAGGVAPNKLSTVSYGEEKPQCTEHNESCWSKNRRAHFVFEDNDK